MDMAAPIFIIVILAVIGILVYIGLREDRDLDPLSERLLQYGDTEQIESLESEELKLPFKDRILIPIAQRVAGIVIRITPQKQL